jgi:putative ABC transport system permease protein
MSKNAVANTINIVGLAIGIASFILIYIHVTRELSYDRFHKDAERLYRLTTIDEALGVSSNNVGITSPLLAKAATETLPEVTEYARVNAAGRLGVELDNEVVFAENAKYVEPSFFQLFNYPLQDQTDTTKFNAPRKVIVSKEFAEILTGAEDVRGKIININEDDWEVIGVLDETDQLSHLELDLVLSMVLNEADSSFANYLDSWNGLGMIAYIKLAREADAKEVEAKLNEITHSNEVPEFWITKLQKLTDVHLKSADILFDGYNANKGDIVYIYSLSAIAFFIILIAVFNFMNLSTAKSSTRAKEVGVRKTVGAGRGSLIAQHLGEAVLISFISFLLALLILGLVSPLLNMGFEENIITYILGSAFISSALVLLVIMVGLLSGLYPAFILSNIKAVNILRGRFQTGSTGVFLRKVLVVAQFVASVSLIVITLLINKQLNYLKSKDLGFSKEQVVTLRMNDPALRENMVAFRDHLQNFESVKQVGMSSNMPGRTFGRTGVTPEGAAEDDENWIVSAFSFDEHYLDAMRMALVEGRNFSPQHTTDQQEAVLVNEALVEQLGWEEPVGRKLTLGNNNERTIIGVVKNFHYASMRHTIEPLIMFYNPNPSGNLSILLSDASRESLTTLENSWNEFYPDYPLEYEFFDDEFLQMFSSDESFSSLVQNFTWLAIFIACLGLFGLSAFIAEQRKKEIGIRKVLGSNIQQAAALITREFILLIIIANILAIPVAYYAMHTWLSDFQYTIELVSLSSGAVYLLAALGTLFIGVLTVSYQAISAALINPVDSIAAE